METKLVKLGDIISLNYGKSLTKKNRIPGDVPVYGSSGITDYHDKPLVDAPSLIIGRKGNIGSVFLSEVPFYPIDTTYFAKESDLNGLDLHFAYYFLKFLPLSEMNTDSAIPGLNRNNFYSLDVVIPDIKSQKIIAFLLDQISYKIKINQQINKNLLQMMETKWRKQFEGLDANQGHFTDLADVVAGGTPSKKQSEYFGGNIAWITPKDMSKTTRVFIEHGTLNITKIGLNNSSAKLIPKGTILFSSRAPIGYIGIAANPVSTNQGFKSLVPKRKEFTEYLYFLLKRLTPLIENIASGSTFKEISGAGMKSVDFPLPTSDMIEAFHHEARSLFDLIRCNEKQSQYLNSIRNLILPKLLSGDINLSGIEEAIKNA